MEKKCYLKRLFIPGLILLTLILLTLLLSVNALAAKTGSSLDDQFTQDNTVPVIVEFKEPAKTADRTSASAVAASGTGFLFVEEKNLKKMDISKEEYETLKKNKEVIGIYPDLELHTLLDSSVPIIQADIVHQVLTNGSGVGICVLDTGVNYDHPALGGPGFPNAKIVAGVDIVNKDLDPLDDHSPNFHGTHVAGVLASADPTYTGVAPDAHIIAVKVMNQSGVGRTSDVIDGISFCANDTNIAAYNIRVISMSIGGALFTGYCDAEIPPLTAAITAAVSKGIIVVASSGNDFFNDRISIPACIQNVVAVGATTDTDTLASFSNLDPEMTDLVAPGVSITSTSQGVSFSPLDGTSFSTPHVSGVAALLFSLNPGLSPAEVESIMKTTAVDVSGYKRVDALAAAESNGQQIPEFGLFGITAAAIASGALILVLRKKRRQEGKT
ncbi:MAG: S8 family serine peptidase [Nanoarchaeota archaeon]